MLVVKNLPANAGDVRERGSISGREDSLEKGVATHSSIFFLENPHGQRNLAAIVHGVIKSWTRLEWLSAHKPIYRERLASFIMWLWMGQSKICRQVIWKPRSSSRSWDCSPEVELLQQQEDFSSACIPFSYFIRPTQITENNLAYLKSNNYRH